MSSTAALELLIQLNDQASRGLEGLAQKGGFLKDAFAFATGGLIEKGIEGISSTVGDFFKNGVAQSDQWDQAMNQVDAALKSTGGAAGVTAKQVSDLASSLSAGNGLSRAADDSIASGEGMLLTFTNIGKNVFPQATQAMLDMATAMNNGAAPSTEELSKTAIQLGKALNDPEKGMTALQKVGVTFTAQQKEQIKTLQESGQGMKAQQLILAELSKEFGGSAAESTKSFGGAMDVLHEKLNNVAQSLGDSLGPALQGALQTLTSPDVLASITDFTDGIANNITAAIPLVTGAFQQFGPIVLSTFQKIYSAVVPVVQAIGQTFMQVLPVAINIAVATFNGILLPAFLAVGQFVLGTLLPAVNQFVGWLSGFLPQAVAIGAQIMQGLLIPVLQFVGNIIVQYVVPAFEQIASWLGSVLPTVISALINIWTGLEPILQAVAQVIFTYVLPALMQVGSFILGVVTPVLNFLGDVLHTLVNAWTQDWGNIREVVSTVGNVIGTVIGTIWQIIQGLATGIGNLLKPVADAFHWLAGKAGDEGTNTGQGFSQNLNTGLTNGIPTLNTNINGINGNLAALQGPAGTYGGNIGGNWIGAINAGVDSGIAALNSKISTIQNNLRNLTTGVPMPGGGSGKIVTNAGLDYAPGHEPALPKTVDLSGTMAGQLNPDVLAKQIATANSQLQSALNDRKGLLNDARDALNQSRGFGSNANVGSPGSVGGGTGNIGGLFTGAQLDTGPGSQPGADGGTGKGGGGGAGAGAVQNAIQAAADMTQKISQAVQAGIAALSQLGNFTLPTGFSNGLAQFAAGVNLVMMQMQSVALAFQDKMLTHTSLFLDTAIKAVSLLSQGVTALSALKDFKAPTQDSMTSFAEALVYILALLQNISTKWSTDAIALMSVFADSAGKMIALVSSGVDALVKLRNFQAPAADAMTSFTNALDFLIDALRSVIAKWDSGSLAAAAQFGDSMGKFIGGISSGIDALTKLVSFKAPAQDAMTAFANAFDYVTNLLRDVVAKWSTESLTGAASFGDSMGKFLAGVGAGVDTLTKLVSFRKPTEDAMNAFADALDYLTQRLSPLVTKWSSTALVAASAFGDSVGKFVQGVGNAIGLLGNLVTFKKPSDDAATAFTDSLDFLTDQFKRVIDKWSNASLAQAALFGDSTGKLIQGIGGAFTLMASLLTYKKPSDDAVVAFRDSLDFMTDTLRTVIAKWSADSLAAAALFGDDMGKLLQGIGQALTLLTTLGSTTFVEPSRSAIDAFFTALGSVIADFGARSAEWSTIATQKAGLLGSYIGQLVDGVAKATSLLQALAQDTFKVPSEAAVAAFFDGIGEILNQFAQRATSWSVEATEKTAQLAGYVGGVLDGVGKAVAPLVALGTYKAVPSGSIDAFFADLSSFLSAFANRAASWKSQATDDVAKIAQNIGAIADAIGKVVDPLLKVLGFKAPDSSTPNPTLTLQGGALTIKGAAQGGMDAFFNALTAFIQEFASRSSQWVAVNDKSVQSIATGIGTVMDGVGKAIDPIVKLQNFKAPDAKTLDSFFNAMSYFIGKVQALIASIPSGFVADATTFAAGINSMFSDLKSAMDTASGIKTPADLPDVFKAILSAIQQVVDYLAQTAVSSWASSMNSMATAAEDFARRAIAAFNSIPDPSTKTPGSVPPDGKQPPPPGHKGWVPFSTSLLPATFPVQTQSQSVGHTFNVTIHAGPGTDGAHVARQFLAEMDYQLAGRVRTRRPDKAIIGGAGGVA